MSAVEHPKTILLVEDEALIALTEARVLQKFGYQVITAKSGEEAVKAFERGQAIDLVLMDINLGAGMDGTQAAEIILARHDLPLIFLSSHTERAVVEKTEGITSYGYIVKNSGETVLLASIKMAFRLFESRLKEQEKDRALRESEERLRLALDAAKQGLYDLNVQTGETVVNDEYARMLGYDPREFHETYASWIERIHPDDRDAVSQVFRDYVDGKIPEYRVEFRLCTRTGEWKWILSLGKIVAHDESGQPLRMLGTHTDIAELKLAEKRAHKSEELFKGLFESFPLATFVWEKNGDDFVLIDVNHMAVVLTDKKAPNFLGQTARQIYPDRADIISHLEKSYSEKNTFSEELVYLTRSTGRLENLIFTYAFVNPNMVMQHSENITHRKKAEVTLHANQELMRQILQTAMDGFWRVDVDGRILDVNQSYCQMVGYSEEELLQMTISDLDVIETPADTRNRIARVIENGRFRFETQHRCKDGRILDVEVSVACINRNGDQIFAFLRDITEQKQAAIRIRESEAAFKSYFNMGTVGMCVSSPEKGWIQVNDCLCRMLGYSHDELLKLTWAEMTHPDDLTVDLELFNRVLRGEIDTYQLEKRFIRKDGEVIDTILYTVCQRQPDGSVEHFLTSIVEITERKRMEDALNKSDLRYRSLFLNANDAILIADDQGQYVDVNPSACQQLGYPREELLRMKVWDITPQANLEQSRLLWADFIARGEQVGEYEIVGKDGQRQFFDYRATVNILPGVHHTVLRNITARKQAEEALQQSREMYRLLAENISDVIWILDLESGRFRYVSPSVERLRGYSVEEIISQDMSAALTPRSLEELQLKLPGRIQAFYEGNQGPYIDEVEQPCKDGSTVWTETTTSFYADSTNTHVEVYGVSRNITERKHTKALLELRLELLELAAANNMQQFVPIALDKIGQVVDSPIGFYHFVEPDQRTISMQAWSTRTLQEFCEADENEKHYDLDEAGIWADCIRQAKPIIHNDFQAIPNRRGLPDGHSHIIREVVVPVLRDGRIVAILGLGNKPVDYIQRDVDVVAYLADVIWEILRRKQAEEALQRAFQEKKVLLRELQHRAKNSFALITSMISLMQDAARSADTKSSLEELGSRVKAMAELYNLLYVTEMVTEAQVDEYCARVVNAFHYPANIQLRSDYDPVVMSVKTAAPLGLILTELLTNAVKYAFPNGRPGILSISLKKTGRGALLTVEDDGVGLPPGFDLSSSSTLGLILAQMLAQQIEGELRIETHNGTRCTLDFPVSTESTSR